MRAGGPSLNPAGRPRGETSLAAALRKRLPPQRLAEMAEQLLAGDVDADVKLAALDFVARRGYASSLASMVRRRRRDAAAATLQNGAA